jgi:hypothetical protein
LLWPFTSILVAAAWWRGIENRGWFTLEKRPCSSPNFWANLKLAMPDERCI